MIRIPVDCNHCEAPYTIVIRESLVIEFELKVGDRVVLHEPGMECEAILRRGETWPWVADIIDGTKETPTDDGPLT